MMYNQIKKLIQNLRRGDDMENSLPAFLFIVENDIENICKTFTLRWLISVNDTYIDHGNDMEKRNAMAISIYANLIKMADTVFEYHVKKPIPERMEYMKTNVVHMYDKINSVMMATDDMPNILFYRFDELLQSTPVLHKLFEEIKQRFARQSYMMQLAKHHKGFYDKIFFEDRKNFKNG